MQEAHHTDCDLLAFIRVMDYLWVSKSVKIR